MAKGKGRGFHADASESDLIPRRYLLLAAKNAHFGRVEKVASTSVTEVLRMYLDVGCHIEGVCVCKKKREGVRVHVR